MIKTRIIEAEIVSKNVTEKYTTYKVVVNIDSSNKFKKDFIFDIRAQNNYKFKVVRGKIETTVKKAKEFNIGDIVNIRSFSNMALATPAYYSGKISKKRI